MMTNVINRGACPRMCLEKFQPDKMMGLAIWTLFNAITLLKPLFKTAVMEQMKKSLGKFN
jgi:hypothetical protein